MRLRPWLSEFGLLRCRVRVEVEWFVALASAGLAGLAPPGPAAIEFLSRLVADFSVADAEAVKAIEQRTNHDVKAVEYWLGERFAPSRRWPARPASSTSRAPARTSTTPATR